MQSYPLVDRSSLPGVRRLLRAEFARAGIDQSLCFDCLVAVTEACTNALGHDDANASDAPAPEIGWEITPESGHFHIRHHSARRWSMSSHPSRDLERMGPAEAEERVGGLGVDLMRNLVDDVKVTRGPDGTTVSLFKRFC